MTIHRSIEKQIRHLDEVILDNIWRSLRTEKTISAIDVQDISVSVDNGQVCLSGHVSMEYNNQQIEEITRSIPGVMAVHNHLVSDSDLKGKVTRSLKENESTQPFSLPVTCFHGWVEVGGLVPTLDLQTIVEATAASVAAVRGVILLPSIQGENTFKLRDALQPCIGMHVFSIGETEGSVYHVVVNPQNRLVTHAIVRVSQIINDFQELSDYLLPVESLRVMNASGYFFLHQPRAIYLFPLFIAANYPLAPFTWQPPYPYVVGNVRWPHLEKVTADQLSTENTKRFAN